MCRLGESPSFPPPIPVFRLVKNMGMSKKKKKSKAILGAPQAIAKCCITVSQENVFLQNYQPDLPEHKCFYLHAHKQTVIMHAIEIRSLDHSGRGGHLISAINMQTFGCLFKWNQPGAFDVRPAEMVMPIA